MRRSVNFYIGALVITIAGAIASLAIINTAHEAEAYGHGDAYFAPAGLSTHLMR